MGEREIADDDLSTAYYLGGEIMVISQGRIIERGRHDELMALRGTYFELFTLQARAYGGMGLEVDGDTVGP